MTKFDIRSNKGTYTVEGTDKLATIKKNGITIGQIKQIITNKYEVKNKTSKIGLLVVFGSKLTLQNSTGKDLTKIDCRKGVFTEEILATVIKTYFE